jgi:hypothetical protein
MIVGRAPIAPFAAPAISICEPKRHGPRIVALESRSKPLRDNDFQFRSELREARDPALLRETGTSYNP